MVFKFITLLSFIICWVKAVEILVFLDIDKFIFYRKKQVFTV